MYLLSNLLHLTLIVNPWPVEPQLVDPWPAEQAPPPHDCLRHGQYDHHIAEAAEIHDVDPALIRAVIYTESRFRSKAKSRRGASGLMQLLPTTAKRLGIKDRWDPRQNILGGTEYLRILLDYFDGNVTLALASYNAGIGRVLKYNRRIPPYRETQRYVKSVKRHMRHAASHANR